MENWLDIKGYEGLYQVSDLGRVRSLVRLLPESHAKGVIQVKKVLAFGANTQGRLQVSLCSAGVAKRFLVHILVLSTFKGPRPDGLEGRHLDCDYSNNQANNLVWATHAEILSHAIRMDPCCRLRLHHAARLSADQVTAIRSDTRSQRKIAADYGITQVAVHHIKHRKTWKHLA